MGVITGTKVEVETVFALGAGPVSMELSTPVPISATAATPKQVLAGAGLLVSQESGLRQTSELQCGA